MKYPGKNVNKEVYDFIYWKTRDDVYAYVLPNICKSVKRSMFNDTCNDVIRATITAIAWTTSTFSM